MQCDNACPFNKTDIQPWICFTVRITENIWREIISCWKVTFDYNNIIGDKVRFWYKEETFYVMGRPDYKLDFVNLTCYLSFWDDNNYTKLHTRRTHDARTTHAHTTHARTMHARRTHDSRTTHARRTHARTHTPTSWCSPVYLFLVAGLCLCICQIIGSVPEAPGSHQYGLSVIRSDLYS